MSSSSSFDYLNDLDSVKSEKETEIADFKKELEALKMEFEAKIQKLAEKVEKMEKGSVEEENILTSISGSWSIVSSVGMKELIRKWKPSPINDALFQVGTQNFECKGNVVTTFGTIGWTRHWNDTRILGNKEDDSLMFVENNVLNMLKFGDNGEVTINEKYSVKNGQLQVVTKRLGVECTRIYEKVDDKKEEDYVPECWKLEEGDPKSETTEKLKVKDNALKMSKKFETDLEHIRNEFSSFKTEWMKCKDQVKKLAIRIPNWTPKQLLPIKTEYFGSWEIVSSPRILRLWPVYFLKNGEIVELTFVEKFNLRKDYEKKELREKLYIFVENNHTDVIERKPINGSIVEEGKIIIETIHRGNEKTTLFFGKKCYLGKNIRCQSIVVCCVE